MKLQKSFITAIHRDEPTPFTEEFGLDFEVQSFLKELYESRVGEIRVTIEWFKFEDDELGGMSD